MLSSKPNTTRLVAIVKKATASRKTPDSGGPEPSGDDDERREAEQTEEHTTDDVESAPSGKCRDIQRTPLRGLESLDLLELRFTFARHQLGGRSLALLRA